MIRYTGIIIALLSWFIPLSLFAQEDEFDKLLNEEVENINPVYKPVVGFGAGILNYFGDVKNNVYTPTLGTLGYKVNVATYIDNKHYTKANFYFVGGKLTGNERSTSDLSRNFNFQTDIYAFGININYDFDNLFRKKYSLVQPFVAIGVESVLFNSKHDAEGSYYDPETRTKVTGVRYNYWSDGTIRNVPDMQANSIIMERDFIYETTMKDPSLEWGQGDYPEYAFSIPFDIGLDMHVSNRITLRIANSFHYTFTDNIDHVSSKNDGTIPGAIVGDKKTDWFNFTYVSIHFDLFSSKKMLTIERLFRDVDYDYSILFGDEDNDLIYDGWDECPGTPLGARVDSLGCPVDSDNDGVPDYKDDEMFSRKGAFVNEQGVEITEDDLIALLDKSMAVGRNEIDLYIRTPGSYAERPAGKKVPIPQKFKPVDADNDNYISFDEMLKAIDSFFDFKSTLTASDIYELNNFFFSQ